ncbi:hypothetical protein FQN54_006224 [Arachnomyces sp. PD_36]|nr:hypothetical protein FQN54_006224 [Arachnomyces sp. PD_36]
MVQPTTDDERAVQLAREAVELVDAGHKEAASRNLREAISLAPGNAEVNSLFLKIREDEESHHPLLELCRRFVLQRDEDAGKETARYLRTDGLKPPEEVALDSIHLVLGKKGRNLPPVQDEIISGLVRQSISVRRYFADELQKSVTRLFDEIYDRGDGAVVCLDTIVLDGSLWPSEEVQSHCESELFQLFIAKLMESGHDHDGRSLKGIARLLAVHAGKLQHLVDEEGFDVILSSLDNRLPIDVRSQATLATAKYLEASGEVGQKFFSDFITAKVAKQKHNDFVVAFSAAAAVFPIVPAITAGLFLTEGFLQSLIPLLDRRMKSQPVALAVLELFNAACIDRACREAVTKYCTEWLTHVLSNGTDETSALAAVVLAKIRATEKLDASESNSNGSRVQEENSSVHELVDRFKGLMSSATDGKLHNLMEGLAYSSVKPEVKEQLANDPAFLKDLFEVLKTNTNNSSLVYGGLMIISNITQYLPNLSEEQKKMSQLKAYANASKASASTPDPLDHDKHVTARCDAVIEAGIMPALIECGKLRTVSIQDLTGKIIFSLSKNSKCRGRLAQQGAVKLLLAIIASRSGGSNEITESAQNTSHALARILISVNPSHVFPSSGVPQVTSAIRPLVSLLTPPESTISSEQTRDLLPVFESLLALTNLASYPDVSAAESIIRLGWATIEDLMLANSTFIRRAACELVCNLTTCEKGVGKFADGSNRAGQRMHIILALADVDDLATRRAAGGALAMLTEYDAATSAVLDRKRGVEIILGLCREKESDLVHRGLVCVKNITAATGDIGNRAREAVLKNGGVDTLRDCLRQTSNPMILQLGVEILKPLVQTAG